MQKISEKQIPNEQLKRQREIRNWTQQRVADELSRLDAGCGMSARDIGRWERGNRRPGPFYREKLCQLFGCTSEQLGFVPDDEHFVTHTSPDQQQLLEEDIMGKRFDPTRRLALQFLGAAGVTAATITPTVFNPDSWDRLSYALTKPSSVDQQALAHIEQLNDVCWNLSNVDQLEMVAQILPTYLPKITTLAHQSSGTLQNQAASLVARGYILAAEIDKDNVPAMEAYASQAVFYSLHTDDVRTKVDALRQQGTIALVAKKTEQALVAYQKSLPLLDQVSPLLRSRMFLGLASASARLGHEMDALKYLGLALDHFPAHPDQDSNILYMYASKSRSVLHLYEALTYNDLNQPAAAWNALMYVDGLKPKMPVTESARIEFVILQAKTAAMMNRMDESTMYLQSAVRAADQAGYTVWRQNAADVYKNVITIWPHESQVKALASIF